MTLDDWARTWGVPAAAVADLRARLGVGEVPWVPSTTSGSMSEAAVQNEIRMEASEKGGRLWRNNVGAGTIMESGSFLRWGLCNESEQMNKSLKSSDLIGLKPVVIQPHMVGQTLGQFWSREVKPTDWKYRGTPRERAQLNFINLVVRLGGDAAFATGRGTL